MFMLNLLLALAWLALTGEFSLLNFLIGFVIATVLIAFVQRVLPKQSGRTRTTSYSLKAVQMISFGLFFIWELILANIRVAIDVLRPRPQIEPAVVAVPLDGFSDAEVTLLANFITLTPGTLSLDVSLDVHDEVNRDGRDVDNTVIDDSVSPRVLYVHAMHAGRTQAAIEEFRRQLQQKLGRRVTEVMR